LPDHKSITSLNYKSLIENEMLQKYLNTLISYLYKGSEKVTQDFRLTNFKPNSIMSKIVKHYSIKDLHLKGITIHVISYFIIKDLCEIFEGIESETNIILKSHQKIINKKKTFESNEIGIYEQGLISEIRKLRIFLKYNNYGFIGYQNYELFINYGEINKFYKKSKSLNNLEKEQVLLEIRKLKRIEKLGVTCG